MRNASNLYHFLVDVHYEITIIYIYEKLLLFVVCRCHEKGKRGMIYFESIDTQKAFYSCVYNIPIKIKD